MKDKIRIIFYIILFLFVGYIYFDIFNIPNSENSKEKKMIDIKRHENWIIVTSIYYPTEQCKNLSNISGFNFLVIGDKKTPTNWTLNNVTYLNLEHQKSLNLKLFSTTPTNSYNRKNIGYLYAIMHGAKFIYDTDDDNSPLVNLSNYFNYNEFDFGLVLKSKPFIEVNQSFVNPYAHFGQPTLWPRGFPLSGIKNYHFNDYYSGRRKASVIQQGLVNGDPDVDAVFRLTKSRPKKKFEIYFDSSSPSVQIPKYMFSPFNSQNTLYSYKAFWSLYLPKTVSFRLTDIWRSYWAQRLLWLLDETITFRGPSAYQIRNSHSYLKDFEEERSMYFQTEKLIIFLLEWKCFNFKFYECLIDLSIQMANNDFWGHDEIDSIKSWLDDLNKIGYKEPEILNHENDDTRNNLFEVRYTPKFQKGVDFENYCSDENLMEKYEKMQKLIYFQNFCKNSSEVNPLLTLEKVVNSNPLKFNYLLLVTFNHQSLEENIIFIKNFYEEHFQNIVFCGNNILKVLNSIRFKSRKFDSYSFIELNTVWGYFHYYCMNKVIEMNFNTEGIILMSDDVLLKYLNLKSLNPNKIWYHANPITNAIWDQNEIEKRAWMWWKSNLGISSLKNVWNEFAYILNGNSTIDKNIVLQVSIFLQNLRNQKFQKVNKSIPLENDIVYVNDASDCFYLPKKLFEIFHIITELFRKNNVFLEIAVPTILAGIANENSIEIINGIYSWGGYQFDLKDYNSTFHFAHPLKLSNLQNRKLICDVLINERYRIMLKKN